MVRAKIWRFSAGGTCRQSGVRAGNAFQQEIGDWVGTAGLQVEDPLYRLSSQPRWRISKMARRVVGRTAPSRRSIDHDWSGRTFPRRRRRVSGILGLVDNIAAQKPWSRINLMVCSWHGQSRACFGIDVAICS